MMVPLREKEGKLSKVCSGAEVEIEKILVRDVEVKRRDLLPVFDNFHNTKSDWNERYDFFAYNRICFLLAFVPVFIVL